MRTKSNQSGSVSGQVIDKSLGTYPVVKTIGSSADDQEVLKFKRVAKEFILSFEGQQKTRGTGRRA